MTRVSDRSYVSTQIISSMVNNRYTSMMAISGELSRREICGCCGRSVGTMTYPHIAEHGYDNKEDFYRDYPRCIIERHIPNRDRRAIDEKES
jgi:hypothetical protein